MTPEVAVRCGDVLGESATWSAREQALYWVDIRAPALHRYDPLRRVHRRWPLPELCAAVVPMRAGVLLALRRTLARFSPATGRLDTLATVEPESLGNRLNEAKCDRAGRLWVGSMRDYAAATTGSLYAIDDALAPQRRLSEVTIPNSLGWSPDGTTMYFADTAEGSIRAFAYDPVHGALGASRRLLGTDALPGRPDGCTVDAEGYVWTTRFGAGLVARVSPTGEVTDLIELPITQPTSCTFGGPALDTLFVTTARQRLEPSQLEEQPLAGHLFAITTEVRGLPDPEWVNPSDPEHRRT